MQLSPHNRPSAPAGIVPSLLQEEVAAVNLGKYRQLQTQVDDANERADIAENSLAKLRSKNRASTLAPLGVSASASFIRVASQSDMLD